MTASPTASRAALPHRAAEALAAVAGGLLIALMLAQFGIVVLRYLFAFGFSWGLDLLSYLFMASSLLPLVFVVVAGRSIRIDIFQHGYSDVAKARLDRVAFLLLLPACAYTAHASWPALMNSWRLMESSPTLGGLPGYFLLKSLLWLSFAALALAAAWLAWRPRADSPGESPAQS